MPARSPPANKQRNAQMAAVQMSRTARPAFNAIGAVAQATALTGHHSPEPFLGNHLGSNCA